MQVFHFFFLNLEPTYHFRFCTEALGMKLLRKIDIPEEKYSHAFLGFGPEESHFSVEFIHCMYIYASTFNT